MADQKPGFVSVLGQHEKIGATRKWGLVAIATTRLSLPIPLSTYPGWSWSDMRESRDA